MNIYEVASTFLRVWLLGLSRPSRSVVGILLCSGPQRSKSEDRIR